MAFDFFGISFGKKSAPNVVQNLPSPVAPVTEDGAVTLYNAASYFGVSYIDIDGTINNDADLIKKYRTVASYSVVDVGIENIVNESIIYNDGVYPVKLNMDNLPVSRKIKTLFLEEFNHILQLLKFDKEAYQIFRRWYIDGRIYFAIITDEKNPKDGILELRPIDPRKIKKIRQVNKDKQNGVEIITSIDEYYVYNDNAFNTSASTNVSQSGNQSSIKFNKDSIICVNSGQVDYNTNQVLGFLHKCLTGDTRIKTPFGWKYINELCVGDEVYSYDYHSDKLICTNISHIWNNGLKDVVKITTKHSNIKCTKDHLILTKNKKTNNIEYIEAENIDIEQHQVVLPKIDTGIDIKFPKSTRGYVSIVTNPEEWVNYKFKGKKKFLYALANDLGLNKHLVYSFVYGNAPVDVELANSILLHIPVDIKTITKIKGNWVNDVIIPEYVTTDFARLFGFLIGDGWVTDYVIGFAEGIYESQNILYKELMIKYFGSCVRRTGKNRVSQYGSYFTGSVLGIDLLKSLGFISGARNKRIPDWVYLAKNDIKMAFMQGLCDADGCDRSKQYSGKWAYTIGLANEKLIYDIKELWTSLGYSSGKIYTVNQPPTIIYGKDVKSFGGAWYINLSKTPINDFDSVTTIELLDDAECVYDIEVESNLHNFIANGIVVHNCIRPSNQLRMLEDAVVIYKLTRAPERRIFYIDVGNLPKAKADEYVRDVMQRYRNKVVYDGVSGEVHGDKKFSSMLEDYFMPRRGDSKGTQIDTLQGSNPGFTDMIDVEYFKRELYRSLNVPFSRLQSETGFNIGRASEISRDEVNFQKFIQRLQKKFSELFLQALETQLILKNVIGVGEFQQYTDYMYIEFLKDNYFEELKENEVLLGRIEAATDLQPFIGKYFSNTWVRKNIFKQTDEDMELMDEEIEEEFQNPIYYPPIMGDGSPMTGGMDGSTDGSIDGAGTGQSGGSGGQVVMTMADVQHTMSKTINQVAQGATIMIKRGGKPVAKLMPAGSNESVINESIQISKINNIQYLLETMKIDESILLNDVQTSIILKKLGN